MQRRKGQSGEREVALLFRAFGWPDAYRRSSGEESQEDHGRDLKGTAPYCVQVNLSDHPNPHKKLSEAQTAAEGDEVPVAFTRKTRGEWLVTMRAEDWLRMACSGRS